MSAPAKAPVPKEAATGFSREQKLEGLLAQIDGNNDVKSYNFLLRG